MNKINFRVWDNLEKAYLNEEDIAIDNQGNIFIFERYDKNDNSLYTTIHIYSCFIETKNTTLTCGIRDYYQTQTTSGILSSNIQD